MTTIGRAEKTPLRKVSKATNLMDRRIQYARQLFNERLARAEAEYHHAMLRAVTAEDETRRTPSEATSDVTSGPAVGTEQVSA